MSDQREAPRGSDYFLLKQRLERQAEKKKSRHDWVIAIVGIVGGGVMGFLVSLIFWLLER